jgi:hypothetical protein
MILTEVIAVRRAQMITKTLAPSVFEADRTKLAEDERQVPVMHA